jgi:hypothetical protein
MNHPMSLCKWEEYSCKIKATESGFCKKHHTRGYILKKAKEKNVRICDDAKRSCRNITIGGKTKCESCLRQIRERERNEYQGRKEKGNVCTMCGIECEAIQSNFGNLIQKCKKCHESSCKIEENRVRHERNYGQEKKVNVQKHFREYIDSAAKRNLPFELTIEQFSEIVNKPCYYCKTYNEAEVIGIDRINSELGYTLENTNPCCKICNMMKGTMSLDMFASHIVTLYKSFAEQYTFTHEETTNTLQPSFSTSQKDIRSLYGKRKLESYITLCEEDKRSPLFIEKLREATSYIMNMDTFSKFLENALRSEGRTQSLTETNRQRVPRKLMVSYLKSTQPFEAVKLYEATFGSTPNLREDMKKIATEWNSNTEAENDELLNKCFTKYNNQRAKCKREGVVETETQIEETIPPVTVKEEVVETAVYIPETFVEAIPEIKEPPPTQWKVTNIYTYLTTNREQTYLTYLKEANPEVKDIEERFITLLTQIKSVSKEDGEKAIEAFVKELRNLRHNALCYKKNHTVIDRDDREVWRADSVLHAFQQNKLEKFKEFTEEYVGDKPDDSSWCKRWGAFLSSVQGEEDETKQKALISKFLTAQRTKKYRRGLTN